jgi:hypothetical protein
MLFHPGQIVATPGALSLAGQGIELLTYLQRHLIGDWGELCKEDKAENNFSLANGFRLLSAYDTPAGSLWIITEADRSVTTFLLPDEY